MFPDVATLSLVLEALTRESTKDWQFFEACQNVWKKFNNKKKVISVYLPHGEFFKIVKVLSVREVVDRYLKILRRQTNPANTTFGRNELVLNILVAKREDERNGNLENALVGSTLSKNSCGDGGNGKFNARYVISSWEYYIPN